MYSHLFDSNSQLLEIWTFKSFTCVQLTPLGLLINSLGIIIIADIILNTDQYYAENNNNCSRREAGEW